jgi:hypothetical protein
MDVFVQPVHETFGMHRTPSTEHIESCAACSGACRITVLCQCISPSAKVHNATAAGLELPHCPARTVSIETVVNRKVMLIHIFTGISI